MRILIVSVSYPYPPASGGEIRIHGIIEGLRRAGHHITLLTFAAPERPAPPEGDDLELVTVPAPVRTKIHRLRDLIFTRQPDIAGRFHSPAMIAALRDLLARERFDVIQFEGIESVAYLPVARQSAAESRLIFDTFNAEYALQQGIFRVDRRQPKRWPAALYSYIQVGRIARFEREMCELADAVVAVSDEDAALLRPFRADGRIHVVPNGIWVDHYAPEDAPNGDAPGSNMLVFTGKMDYRPNVDAMLWFAEAIWPSVQQRVPDVRLVVVGQKPHPRLDALRALPGITLTGWVDSVMPHLRRATVYVAPLRMGSGTRLKLLEAMACGCAIVATPTAAAGLRDEALAGMVIAQGADDFADAVVNLLADPARRESLSGTAARGVRAHYDWSALVPRLLDIYRDLGLGV